MSELREADVRWIVRRLPPRVKAAIEQATTPVFLAGGFVRAIIAGEAPSDIDLFTGSIEYARALATYIGAQVVETPNAITIRDTEPATQIITRWTFTTLADCIESFDFTIARAGLTYSGSWFSYCDADFYSDLAAKRLHYRAPDRREDEAGSMLRLLKFYSRGYRAPLVDIAGVVARATKGTFVLDAATDEIVHRDVILKRLRVVDPAADPEDEGHLG